MKNTQKVVISQKCSAFWVIVFTLLMAGFQVSKTEAQQLRIGSGIHFVNNATVVVNGDSLVIRGTMKNNVNGLIELTGNLKNHGTFTNETGSIITLDGTNPQTIGGSVPTTFSTLNHGNSAGVTLAKDATVNGSLNFQTGILTTGSNLLTIAETGAIGNAAATRYVDGKLAHIFNEADTKIFPIGKDGNYRPVVLQLFTLTGTSLVTAEQFETGLTGTLPADVTLTTTNRKWTITQSGGSDMQYFVRLDATGYTPERPVVMLKKDAGLITSHETTIPNYTNSAPLTSFSEFGLGEECVNPADGGTIAEEQSICYNTTPDPLTQTLAPGGSSIGTLEYKWQSSGDGITFIDIDPLATSEGYSPPTLTADTWYKRLVKVDCETEWMESNIVKITVYDLPDVVAGDYGPVCIYDEDVELAGSPAGGVWSGTGVSGDQVNGYVFDPSVGTQTLTYTYTDGNGCVNYDETDIMVITPPTPDDPGDVTECDSYTLPALTSGNYFDGSGGTGTSYFVGNVITSSMTMYVYAKTDTDPICWAENSFEITINNTPVPDDPADVTECDSYTLPVLSIGNYFDGPGGSGTAYFAGNVITSSMTMYVYAASSAKSSKTPVLVCSAENSFTITINNTPIPDDPADVTKCDSYTLPALTVGNYFDLPGGTGNSYAAGEEITSSMTMYVYAQTGTNPNCSAENTFEITINKTPVPDDPDLVTACDSYTLPALSVGNYFDGPEGSGNPYYEGDEITSSMTMYVYAETGTDPNCWAEESFDITINYTPAEDLVPENVNGYEICKGDVVPNDEGLTAENPYYTIDDLIYSNETPASIPDNNPTGVNSTITIQDDYEIISVIVGVTITHSFIGDLKANLTGPDGTTIVQLFDRPGVPASTYGCSNNNIHVTFDDLASLTSAAFEGSCVSSPPASYAIEGTYQPINPLSAFSGFSTPGDWTLNVSDVDQTSTGNVESWSITIINSNSESITWWNAPTGGNKIGFGEIFDPTDIPSSAGGVDPNIPGTTTYWAQLENVDIPCSTTARVQADFYVDQTVNGTLAKDPDAVTVCEGTGVSATLTEGSGGTGIDETTYRTNDGVDWSSWQPYNSSDNITTSGTTAVEIRTHRLTDNCNFVSGIVESPFAGMPLVIPATTAGLYLNVVNGAISYSDATPPAGWDANPYGSTNISFFSPASPANSYGFVRGLGNSTSLVDNLTFGTMVNASQSFGAGITSVESSGATARILNSSGNYFGFRFINELTGQVHYGYMQVQIGNTVTDRTLLGVWYQSVPNTGIKVGDHLNSGNEYNTVSWNVEQTPVSGTLDKTPDATSVCEGDNVSASFTAGSGGNGTDELTYRTHDGTEWSTWEAYTTGTDISTTGKTQVEIQTLRQADYCSDATANSVIWNVEQTPVSGTFAKTPDQESTCEGDDVSASLTAGSGGNSTDSLSYRTHNGTAWSSWAAYTSGTDISTTDKTQIEIQTLRKADYCSDATANTASWTVEQTPVSGTLDKTPDATVVCEGDNVSASFTAGSGGNGTDELTYRTHDGTEWSSWEAYTTGTDISTTGKTQVEIQTLRQADYCSDATANTASWNIQPKPGAFAGDDQTISMSDIYTLSDATAENYSTVSWATDGDGTFSLTGSVNPEYTPGSGDIASGTVELCLTAEPESPCTQDATDCLILTIERNPVITITTPLQKDLLYSNPVTITGTASDADNNLDLIEVRLNGGSWQTATGTTSWSISLDLIPGKNTLEARATDLTSLQSGIEKVEVTLSIQVINIPQGWSYISSYLNPTNPDIENMWADIVGANNLMIMTGVQGIYAPAPYFINTLGTWDVLKGYKVKMNAVDDLIVSGDSLTDKTVNFQAGVHLIPVLTNQTTPLDEVFDTPETDILYMLDIYSNLVYWPGGILYTLTDLVPGKGYLANFKNPVTLSYPPLTNFTVDNTQNLPPAPGPWVCIRTSNVHLISVSTEAISQLPNADYLGAFDSQGNCVGYASLEKSGTNLLLTVYGDESITAENDGIMQGEMIHFRAYNSFENAGKEVTATFNSTFPNADGLFAANGLSGISGFKESATGVGENDLAASVLVYPNPATDVVNIVLSGNLATPEAWLGFTTTLLTAEGRLMKTFTITSPETQLNVEDLQPGVYMLKLETEKAVVMKRVVIQ